MLTPRPDQSRHDQPECERPVRDPSDLSDASKVDDVLGLLTGGHMLLPECRARLVKELQAPGSEAFAIVRSILELVRKQPAIGQIPGMESLAQVEEVEAEGHTNGRYQGLGD